jgi:hypothetical protein
VDFEKIAVPHSVWISCRLGGVKFIMAATLDANAGTLLFHLNELRHPTRMEARLQQISDEYLLLTESIGKKSASGGVKQGKISLEDLLGHLREELEDNLIPLPDAPTGSCPKKCSAEIFHEIFYSHH